MTLWTNWQKGIFLLLGPIVMISCQSETSDWLEHLEKGERLFQERNFLEAKEEYQNALHEAEKFGEQDLRLPKTLTRLARLYDATSEWKKAQPLLERALDIKENILGRDHQDVVENLRNLGALYLVQHQFDQAERLFQQALWARERMLGLNHPDLIPDIKNLVGIHISRIQFEKAGPFLTRTLDGPDGLTNQKEWTPENTHDDFAKLYTAQKQYNIAKPYLDQAIERDKKSWGPTDPQLIGSVNIVKDVLSNKEKTQEAEILLLRIVKAKGQEKGLMSVRQQKSLLSLVNLYRSQNRIEEAISLLDQRRLKIEEVEETQTQNMVELSSELAVLHHINRHDEEAERLYKQAILIGGEVLGNDHPIVEHTRQNYAILIQKFQRTE